MRPHGVRVDLDGTVEGRQSLVVGLQVPQHVDTMDERSDSRRRLVEDAIVGLHRLPVSMKGMKDVSTAAIGVMVAPVAPPVLVELKRALQQLAPGRARKRLVLEVLDPRRDQELIHCPVRDVEVVLGPPQRLTGVAFRARDVERAHGQRDHRRH